MIAELDEESTKEEHLTVYNDTLMLYSVPEDRSYYCKVDQPVYVGANVTVDVLSAQLQAFRNATAEAVGQFGADLAHDDDAMAAAIARRSLIFQASYVEMKARCPVLVLLSILHSAVECSAGDISNIVPIAVGSALAALVIIVLIAYLIGRSKSRQKGYQSV
ncbi:hypothetical protein HPB51_021702 [Rhipicephalus microplus]|uniref:Lysosome-associated membrane glycoprotein 2-like transmembrane domain-containing protein n=1 Tax=Rhipicephalus microplus TaxID=6941 RepID=A0A9J6D766_RHIMP|nr:hypothetical protein HPB51_021702 [Rhipicephalus microplus]